MAAHADSRQTVAGANSAALRPPQLFLWRALRIMAKTDVKYFEKLTSVRHRLSLAFQLPLLLRHRLSLACSHCLRDEDTAFPSRPQGTDLDEIIKLIDGKVMDGKGGDGKGGDAPPSTTSKAIDSMQVDDSPKPTKPAGKSA